MKFSSSKTEKNVGNGKNRTRETSSKFKIKNISCEFIFWLQIYTSNKNNKILVQVSKKIKKITMSQLSYQETVKLNLENMIFEKQKVD